MTQTWQQPPRLRPNVSEEVSQYIRQLIFGGELRQNQCVPQDEIAATLGVSRLPVREALINLENEGLVHTVARRGAFVEPIEDIDVRTTTRSTGWRTASRPPTPRTPRAMTLSPSCGVFTRRRHAEILAAIERGDADGAARACHLHLRHEGESIVARMATEDFWAGDVPAPDSTR